MWIIVYIENGVRKSYLNNTSFPSINSALTEIAKIKREFPERTNFEILPAKRGIVKRGRSW